MISVINLSDSDDEPMIHPDQESHHSGIKEKAYSEDDPSIQEEEEEEPIEQIAPLENGHYYMAAEENAGYQSTPLTEELAQINVRCDQLNRRDWTKIPKHLREWRQNLHFPFPSENGESSNARQDYPLTHEPPHHTVPLLAAVAHDQETRLDRMKIQMMDMTSHSELGRLGSQVHTMESHIRTMDEQFFTVGHQLGVMKGGVHGLMRREEEMSGCIYAIGDRLNQTMRHVDELRDGRYGAERRTSELARRMEQVENNLAHLNRLVAGLEAYENAWDIVPKHTGI